MDRDIAQVRRLKFTRPNQIRKRGVERRAELRQTEHQTHHLEDSRVRSRAPERRPLHPSQMSNDDLRAALPCAGSMITADAVAKIHQMDLGAIQVSDYQNRRRQYTVKKCTANTTVSIATGQTGRFVAYPISDGVAANGKSAFKLLGYTVANTGADVGATTPTWVAPPITPWSGMDYSTAKFGSVDCLYPLMPLNGMLSVDVAPGGYDVPPYIMPYMPISDNGISNAGSAHPAYVDFDANYGLCVWNINNSDITETYVPAATIGTGNSRYAGQGNHGFIQMTPMVGSNGAQYFCNLTQGVTIASTWTNFLSQNTPVIEVKNGGASTMSVKVTVQWYFAVPLTDMMMATTMGITGVEMKYDRQTLLLAPMSGVGMGSDVALADAANKKATSDHPGLTNIIAASAKSILTPSPDGDHHLGMLAHLKQIGGAALGIGGGAAAPIASAAKKHSVFSGLFGAFKKIAPYAGEVIDTIVPQASGVVNLAESAIADIPDGS